MKTIKYSTVFFIWLLQSAQAFCQTLPVVLEEHFDNNENGWRLLNNQADQSEIRDGKFHWVHMAPDGNSISNYCNLLDAASDFSVEARFHPQRIGSEYGLMLAGIDQENALYFTVKNLQYRIFEFKNGKYTALQDYSSTLKVRPDKNVLKAEKRGGSLFFYLNDHQVHSLAYSPLMGKAFGFSCWDNASIAIDDFVLRGTALKINLALNSYYKSPPENLGPGINTASGELTPVVSSDGKALYFTRTYFAGNKGGATDYQDVYYSTFNNGIWEKAVNLGAPVNNDAPNAVNAVSPDGNTLLLMNTYDSKGASQAMGLSLSHKVAAGWSLPKTLKIRNYYNKSAFNEYFLSGDNKVLLLALQRDDSYGTRDIYVSFLEQDDIWSTPKNLGSAINTPGTELSPFLAADGITLYFSSTGHPGYGKNDIFISRRLDDSWTNWSVPQNMGMPLNSKGIDAYYTIPASGAYAYFVSETKSAGSSDIFRIVLPSAVKPRPVVLIYGKVLNSKTLKPITTGITYRDLSTDSEAGTASSNPGDGSYKITLPYNRAYSFFAEKEGFYSVRDSIDVPDIKEYTEIERNIYLSPLEVGEAIPLRNVFFVRSEATLLSTSYPELNKLAKLLTDNPGIEIELSGHTDNVGSAEKNVVLSEQRVEKVKNYLSSKGVGEERISGKGYGGSRSIADNVKEETRKLNRRVEFKILKF